MTALGYRCVTVVWEGAAGNFDSVHTAAAVAVGAAGNLDSAHTAAAVVVCPDSAALLYVDFLAVFWSLVFPGSVAILCILSVVHCYLVLG